jgi:hypothetical protein
MKKLLAILLSLSMPLSSFADCVKPVTLLEQGAQAPCKGYLFTPEKELEVRLTVKEAELLKAETQALNLIVDRYKKKDAEFNKIIDLQIDKTELWKTKAEDITLKYVAVEENRTKRDFWMVVLGVALTVGAGYAVGQAAGR